MKPRVKYELPEQPDEVTAFKGFRMQQRKAGALTILPVRSCKRQRIPQSGRSSGVTVTVGTM